MVGSVDFIIEGNDQCLQHLLGFSEPNFRENRELKNKLKKTCTKEMKQALLNLYSHTLHDAHSDQYAFTYLLRIGRKTGKVCRETDSLREYYALQSATSLFDSNMKAAFDSEVTLDLDRVSENPYYKRALQHQAMGHCHRALFDFEVAKFIFSQQQQYDQVQQCERELIACYYDAGLPYQAHTYLSKMLSEGVALRPLDQLKGAFSIIECNKRQLHVQSRLWPFKLLCEALAGSQDANIVNPIAELLNQKGAISILMNKYFPNDYSLMIDLLKLLPPEVGRDVMHAFLEWFYNPDDALTKNVCDLYYDVKCLLNLEFDERDELLYPEIPNFTHIYSRLQHALPFRSSSYPSSALIMYEWADSVQKTDVEKARELVAKSLMINPAYGPARLLALALSPQPEPKVSVLSMSWFNKKKAASLGAVAQSNSPSPMQ